MEKYGVTPIELIQVKALMGDSSDNIPGVPGIGEKTALDLISRYHGVEYIYEHLDEIEAKPSVLKKLEAGRNSAMLSLRLGKIDRFAPIPADLSAYEKQPGDEAAAAALLAKLEMFKMIDRLGLDPSKVPERQPERIESRRKLDFVASDCGKLAELSKLPAADILFEASGDDLLSAAVLAEDKIYCFENDGFFFNSAFGEFLASPAKKRTDDLKFLCRWALCHGASVQNCVMDSGLAGYILSVTGDDYAVAHLAQIYHAPAAEIAEALAEHEEILGKAAVFSPLCDILQRELEGCGEAKLLADIELPLAAVLAEMELAGFKIDPAGIREFEKELSAKISETEARVYELSGEVFNILSPKQLGAVLFEKLELPAKKKTKSGYSTSADVLEDLRTYHPVIDEILEYRKLTKLRSTYVDGLLAALAPDGRVHTRFNQKETRTGRISSLEPNLQNIPIRTELGSRMRGFFVAGEGRTLIDADYSQIELRVLAHLSGDENMISAFTGGTDIHTQTAAQVFGVPEDFVTSQMRSRAKAVNFGIVYGIGAYSLGENIGVSYKEAQDYINSYLRHYSGVDRYMKESIEKAKKCGYAVTAYGRRRYLPELTASNHAVRAFGERVARNMPIQGTAADIIKIAMVKVRRRLAEENLDAKLIMQVHDELIVEAAESCAGRAAEILRFEMENAAQLSVPMEVSVGMGKTWLAAH